MFLWAFRKLAYASTVIAFVSVCCWAQSDASNRIPGDRRNDSLEVGKNIRETLAKQRAEREKKEFQELLDRSDQAVKLSDELERSFEFNKQITGADRERLQTLEKLVFKIRAELGGSGDADEEGEEKPPADVGAAFIYLKNSAAKLADQLKKSTRFTISAAAIQTSNNFLRVIRFLRIR